MWFKTKLYKWWLKTNLKSVNTAESIKLIEKLQNRPLHLPSPGTRPKGRSTWIFLALMASFSFQEETTKETCACSFSLLMMDVDSSIREQLVRFVENNKGASPKVHLNWMIAECCLSRVGRAGWLSLSLSPDSSWSFVGACGVWRRRCGTYAARAPGQSSWRLTLPRTEQALKNSIWVLIVWSKTKTHLMSTNSVILLAFSM